jgi:hypothetical protein
MPCRERFTDTHGSVAAANSGAFGKRGERQGVCDASGVYVAQRVVRIKGNGLLIGKMILLARVSTRRTGRVL